MNDDNAQEKEAALRLRAEELLRSKEMQTQCSGTELQKLVHELQVHQIELEMQNAELRQARDDLETAVEKYTDLYDFAPVGYITIDQDGVIRNANLTAALLLGVERSRLINRRFDHFVSGETRPVLKACVEELAKGRGKQSCEVVLAHNGKPPLHVQIEAGSCTPRNECRLALIDITERRQLEEKLEILNSDLAARAHELETANIELEAFNSSVSHDLRRPLGNISGFCQLIWMTCSDRLDEQCSGYIRKIYEATANMTGLIETLLNFSRILRIKMHKDTVDLGGLAQSVATSLTTADPERAVTFKFANRVNVQGDSSLLEIVLNNLIGNAWKYAGKKDGAVIEFGVTEKEGKPVYFVRDNGPGFDMADADQLFAPFQRLSGTEAEGHGIGLAMVDRIIRRHGGRVWAESEPGKGATFYFTLNSEGTAP